MNKILRFDEEHGVLRMEIPSYWEPGHFDENEAFEIIDQVQELYKDREHRYMLVDVSRSPGSGVSKEFRRWMAEQATRIGLEKVAIVGASPITRMVSRIVMAALGKSNDSRFFRTDDEALRWLTKARLEAARNETHSLV